MATKYHITMRTLWIIMLLGTLDTISRSCVEGLKTLDRTKYGPTPRGTMKTIEDGDMIDCIDIYKQPAFNDPRTKELKMAPSNKYMCLFKKTINSRSKVVQNWLKYGECPKGTVSIRRPRNNNGTIHRKTTSNDGYLHEYAIGRQKGSTYQGAGATFNVWNPRVRGTNELSLAQLWLVSGAYPDRNTIESGWVVCPSHYGDSQTRLFSHWTADDYQHTGCWDEECPGFVQTNERWVLGGVLNTVSTYGGAMADMRITVARDWETKDWWLEVEGTQIGYFDHSFFTTMQDGANLKVEFGGEIVNEQPGSKHTGTHMGSGHFPHEGPKTSYVRNIEIANDQYQVVAASLEADITRPECYDLIFGPAETGYNTNFYYGGPGFSRDCYVG